MSEGVTVRVGAKLTTVTFAEPGSPRSELLATSAPVTLPVFDANTVPLFGTGPESPAASSRAAGALVVLPSGETAKEMAAVESILVTALEAGLARDGCIVGVGGGVVCDSAAFSASIFMRGCRLVLVPTTLLAMVDAAVGGKTGVNFSGYKNMVGTFYPAEEVRVDVDLLATLPDRELKSGLAEVIKSALLGDADLFGLLKTEWDAFTGKDRPHLVEAVRRSLAVKAAIVEEDPTETGSRAYLNLGHTFAHALESVAGFGRWTHGEAVAWGMARALDLGVAIGITPKDYRDEVRQLLDRCGYRTAAADGEVDPSTLLAAMKKDKKKKGGTVRFVLQEGLGCTVLRQVEDEKVLEVVGGTRS